MPKRREVKSHVAHIYGKDVAFWRCNPDADRIVYKPRWPRDTYNSERDARIAKYVFEKKHIVLLPSDIAKTKEISDEELPLFEKMQHQPEGIAL